MRSAEASIRELDAPEWEVRRAAQLRLAALGRRVAPLLREAVPRSAEARMRIEAILESFAQLELHAELFTSSQSALGAPIGVRVVLTNYTKDSYRLPLDRGNESYFVMRIGDQPRRLPTSDVLVGTGQGLRGLVTLGPGDRIELRMVLRSENLPRRAAGTYELVVEYESGDVLRLDPADGNEQLVQGDRVPTRIESNALHIDIRTRDPKELEEALDDPKRRTRALVELQLRDDAEILPLLRRHADDPDLRLHAIQRLGAKADARDLELIVKALRDPDSQVRVAATTALAAFDADRAWSRLALLARTDEELRVHAVRALAGRKCALSIDTFRRVLLTNREGPWVPIIQHALQDWTGLIVENRPTEIRRFEEWWRDNRERWIRENGK